MKFRSHFDYDVEAASNEAAIPVDGHGESLTIQSQSEDADINVMMKRFGVGIPLPETARVPTYGDFTMVRDYRSAMDALIGAQEAFMELPASVRARFDNDPQLLLEFASIPENIGKLKEMGLGKEIVHGIREGSVGSAGGASGASAATAGSGSGGDGGGVAGRQGGS